MWIGAIRHTAHGFNDLLSHFQQWVDTVSVLRVMSTPSPSLTKVAIVGASGYSGEELCALLDRHPMAEVTAVFSRQYAGQSLGEVMPRFTGHKIASLVFTEADPAKERRCVKGAELGLPFLSTLTQCVLRLVLKQGFDAVDLDHHRLKLAHGALVLGADDFFDDPVEHGK